MLSVIDRADSYHLVSDFDAAAVVGDPLTVEYKDLISRASDVISRHCNRVFRLETVTEQFRLDQFQNELILARYPVVNIVSIVEAGVSLTSQDYEADLAKGILTRLINDRECTWLRAKVIVTYRAGYELEDVPPALQRACLDLVKSYCDIADREVLLRSESVEGKGGKTYYSTGDIEHLSPEVRGLLNQFKKFKVGG